MEAFLFMSNSRIRVLLTGGGTGGHIYPALAIGKGIEAKVKSEFLYVGTTRGLEADLAAKAGYAFKAVTAEGLSRKLSWAAVRAGLKSCKGAFEAWQIIKEFKPHVVIGTGGYVCGPVVLVASKLGIPTLIHEQNAYPGITNKILARFVDKICVTFAESKKYFKTKGQIVHTGLPIRQDILAATRAEGLEHFNIPAERTNILVVGGSLGAQRLNEAVASIYPFIIKHPEYQLIHVTGKSGYEDHLAKAKKQGIYLDNVGNIIIKPYIYQMDKALAAADIIIGRAGASFLAEIMARGLPSILVPYPFAAENHQEHNARTLEKAKAARVILEKDLDGNILLQNLEELLLDKNEMNRMAEASKLLGRPEALHKIVDEVMKLVK
jgi:UDP-N-acetylglucosamine--N-acetylmuramyl-(pentapeptide) pyrophosphoryl-undecaprenol N-acetylglucosamine transferase